MLRLSRNELRLSRYEFFIGYIGRVVHLSVICRSYRPFKVQANRKKETNPLSLCQHDHWFPPKPATAKQPHVYSTLCHFHPHPPTSAQKKKEERDGERQMRKGAEGMGTGKSRAEGVKVGERGVYLFIHWLNMYLLYKCLKYTSNTKVHTPVTLSPCRWCRDYFCPRPPIYDASTLLSWWVCVVSDTPWTPSHQYWMDTCRHHVQNLNNKKNIFLNKHMYPTLLVSCPWWVSHLHIMILFVL